MEKHSVGQTIAALRKKKGWTQVELAEKLQVSDKAVSKWEKDDSYPSIEFLPVLASLFGVTIDYLITGATKSEKTVENTPKKVEEEILADDPRIKAAIHNGILNIDEILASKNYKLIKTAIESYPICQFELNYVNLQNAKQMLADGNWRDLFRFAVDKGSSKLIKFVLERNVEFCEKMLDGLCKTMTDFAYSSTLPSSGYNGVNAQYLRLRKSPNAYFRPNCSYEAVLKFIASCKQQVLDDCANLYDKESKVAELTKEYFESELEKGNTEIVIIKLCVRLEAILRCDYHYEGEFSEMLNEYCSKDGREDDGWGYDVEANFVKYLHKLRKCRNNIVHSERPEEAMTIHEIKISIEYICKMG